MAHPIRRGFTLIELMLALGLSLGIVLLAYTAVRESTRTLTAMQRMATENALLRTGYLAVVEDADYWHSQANPDYPYLKGYMSDASDALIDGRSPDQRYTRTNGVAGNLSSNKRMFLPIAFPTALTSPRNPNWQQPHDPRTWYRNYLLPGVIGLGRKAQGQDFDGPASGQCIGHNEGAFDDWNRRNKGEYLATWPTCPDWTARSIDARSATTPGTYSGKGWHPWHLHGDYTVVSNLAMHDALHAQADPTKPGTPPTDRDREAGARQTLIWNLFKNLGQLGVVTYTAPGTANLIVRPTTNLTTAAIGDPRLNWDKGEVPWSLGTTAEWYNSWVGADADHYVRGATDYPPARIATGPKKGNGDPANVVTDNDNWRGHYADAMFAPDYNVDVIIQPQSFACDFGSVIAWNGSPLGIIYATRPLLANVVGPRKYNWKLQIDNGVVQPFIQFNRDIILNQDTIVKGVHQNDQSLSTYDFRSFMYARRWCSNTTYHVPSRHTDDPDPDLISDRQQGLPAMGTTVFRYQLNGDDKVMCSIRVGDDREGRVLELRFGITTTTYRGARQHWGQRTQSNDSAGTLKNVGDVYRDPGNVYP